MNVNRFVCDDNRGRDIEGGLETSTCPILYERQENCGYNKRDSTL